MPSRFAHVRLFGTLWMVAYQAPLSRGFSRQEYWSGLPCPPPGDLPDPGIESMSLTSPALVGSLPLSATWESEKQKSLSCVCILSIYIQSVYCIHTDCIVWGILRARILEWVAFPFSRGSSQPGDQTQVSHIAGGFFTSWATRDA